MFPVLSGTPIQAGAGVERALLTKKAELEVLVGRLALVPAHAALFLLRNAFAIPKLLYILRTAPCADYSHLLNSYDQILCAGLSSLLNIDLTSSAWSQACLPVKWGGVGVRSAYRLAPSAFLASAAGAAELLSTLLPPRVFSVPDPAVMRTIRVWSSLGGSFRPLERMPGYSGSGTRLSAIRMPCPFAKE